MNIRMSERQLRFRITHDEVLKLLYGEELQLHVPFDVHERVYHVHIDACEPQLIFSHIGKDGVLSVNRTALEALEQNLPTREGIRVENSSGMLVLEVDVRRPKPHKN